MAALKGKPGVKPLAIPYASLYFLQFNAKASPALGNPAFWEAARWLFDYQGIADDLLKGQFQSHQAFLPDGYLGRSRSSHTASIRRKPKKYWPKRG